MMHFGTYFFVGEDRYKFCFPSGVKSTVPVWEEDCFPPLLPQKAERIAKQFLKLKLPEHQFLGAGCSSYKLQKTWGVEPLDCYWYYAIEFQVPDFEDPIADHSLLDVPVLFDGTIPPLVFDPYRK